MERGFGTAGCRRGSIPFVPHGSHPVGTKAERGCSRGTARASSGLLAVAHLSGRIAARSELDSHTAGLQACLFALSAAGRLLQLRPLQCSAPVRTYIRGSEYMAYGWQALFGEFARAYQSARHGRS